MVSIGAAEYGAAVPAAGFVFKQYWVVLNGSLEFDRHHASTYSSSSLAMYNKGSVRIAVGKGNILLNEGSALIDKAQLFQKLPDSPSPHHHITIISARRVPYSTFAGS